MKQISYFDQSVLFNTNFYARMLLKLKSNVFLDDVQH